MRKIGRRLFPVLLALLTLLPGQSAAAEVVPAEDVETAFSAPWIPYFGLLHAHTDLSDGLGSVEEAFHHAAQVPGLDFFAVTDHSNSLDPEGWASGKAAAAAVTGEDFLGLFGYEMTWQESKQVGHMVTFGTEGYLSREQPEFESPVTGLEAYYEALTALPGSVSMFCHPGEYYGDFHSFGHYRWEYDRKIHLLEVISGGEAVSADSYGKALDAGWHLAPAANQNNHNGQWGDADRVRTVILADDLTQAHLLEAIRAYRVYATEDGNLRLYFELDGAPMGSRLARADRPEIFLWAWDPDGESIGTVRVLSEGGQVLATECISDSDTAVPISVPGGFRYYYLEITQPDGNRAVTAPVWVEGYEDMGIGAFSADTETPVQDTPLTVTLSLYNREPVAFDLERAVLYADGQPVQTLASPGTVPPEGSLELSFPYTHPLSGEAVLRATVRGSVLGLEREYEAELTLRFRSGAEVTGVLVDGSHQNTGLDAFERLLSLTEEAKLDLTLVTGDLPQGGDLLIVPSPEAPLEEGFLQDVLAFTETGGDLVLWGRRAYLQPLLQRLGVTMDLGEEPVDGTSAKIFNSSASWCANIVPGQYFVCPESVAVEPGEGTWLVKTGEDGPVLLACQETSWGGTVFLAGGPFLQDSFLPVSSSPWDLPTGNETILRAILDVNRELPRQQTVEEVRRGTAGRLYRIRGYVTAGSSNPFNRFPGMVYIQDDTGGIAVTGTLPEGLQVGQPVEVLGTPGTDGRNPVLEATEIRLLPETFYRYAPRTIGCAAAMDYGQNGGRLVCIEGRVTELSLTEDQEGISRLVIRDIRGVEAIVEIEGGIGSGATGKNSLADTVRLRRTVRAMGIVHINKAGETVLRVRNCDEVVYVPPVTDPSNPDTSDRRWKFP